MQVSYSSVEITAYSEDEALDLLNEMHEEDMDYPFDGFYPQIEVDTSNEITFVEVGEEGNHLVVMEDDVNA